MKSTFPKALILLFSSFIPFLLATSVRSSPSLRSSSSSPDQNLPSHTHRQTSTYFTEPFSFRLYGANRCMNNEEGFCFRVAVRTFLNNIDGDDSNSRNDAVVQFVSIDDSTCVIASSNGGSRRSLPTTSYGGFGVFEAICNFCGGTGLWDRALLSDEDGKDMSEDMRNLNEDGLLDAVKDECTDFDYFEDVTSIELVLDSN